MDDSTASTSAEIRPPRSPTAGGSDTAVVWFFTLAYCLSWGWLITVGLGGGLVSAGHGWPTHLPALLGPLVAAIVVTARRDGRSGLADLVRRMRRVRVPTRWWLFAVSPLLLLAVVVAVDAVVGWPAPSYGDFAVFSGVPSRWGVLGVSATIFLVNGFGEETGWRGFALPALQERHNPIVSTLIVAALWAGWHAPMFFTVATFRTFSPAITVGWIIGLFSGSIVLTWLYNRTGGSILLVALWHTTYNLISGTDAATGLLAATSTTLVIGLAIVLVAMEIQAIGHGRASVLGPTA